MWKSIVLSAALLVGLSACQSAGDALKLFDEVRDKGRDIGEQTVEKGADAVDRYCADVSEDTRMWLRDTLNSRTEKGDVEVNCAE